jgi:pimeloyl-ACP methyl ester carboxylesterase
VILVTGYRNTAAIWDMAALAPDSGQTAVFPGVASFTRVCAYDRPGTLLDDTHFSRSDPIPMTRNAKDVFEELHTLLQVEGVPGSYVLVGHSFGGLFDRLYASTYPGEVVGMVLVDALAEGVQSHLTPEEWERYQQVNNMVPEGLEGYHELEMVDFAVSVEQMRQAAAANPMPPMPLEVLTHGEPFGVPPDILGFSPEKLEEAWTASQNELAALVPGAKFIVATKSAHYIQLTEPELVIDAIRQVVDAVRGPATWATPAAVSEEARK